MNKQPPKRLRRIVLRRLDEIETVAKMRYDMVNKEDLVDDLLAAQMRDPEIAAMLRPLRRHPSWWR